MTHVLGIETSCDETAAAIVDGDGAVKANVVASQIPIHARYGGVVPELASRNHLAAIRSVVTQALTESAVSLDAVDAIAVTQGPGLAGCLLVGLQFAKALAWSRELALVPVDHIQAHVHAPFLADGLSAGPRPEFPYLALAVSGGHTSLCRVDAPGRSETLGQTLDDAAGEAFDKAAKMMGLPYPGGVVIDRLSSEGERDAFNFPRPVIHRGLDFSFSGLKTALRYALAELDAAGASRPMADLAASYQEAIVDCLVTKSLRASRVTGIKSLVVAGGVACNTRLRERLQTEAARVGVTLSLTAPRYCTDNAAMIAGLGLALLEKGGALEGDALTTLDIYTTQRPRS